MLVGRGRNIDVRNIDQLLAIQALTRIKRKLR